MSRNYISEVAKMLGLEIGEKFDIIDSDGNKIEFCPYRFLEDGIFDKIGEYNYVALHRLLIGECTIQKHQWKPKDRGTYYRIFSDARIRWVQFDITNTVDLAMLAMGNCFPTKEAAKARKKEILKKFDEI